MSCLLDWVRGHGRRPRHLLGLVRPSAATMRSPLSCTSCDRTAVSGVSGLGSSLAVTLGLLMSSPPPLATHTPPWTYQSAPRTPSRPTPPAERLLHSNCPECLWPTPSLRRGAWAPPLLGCSALACASPVCLPGPCVFRGDCLSRPPFRLAPRMSGSGELRQLAAHLTSLAALKAVVAHSVQTLLEPPLGAAAPLSGVERVPRSSLPLAVAPSEGRAQPPSRLFLAEPARNHGPGRQELPSGP